MVYDFDVSNLLCSFFSCSRKEVIEGRKCCLTPVNMHSFGGKAPVHK